MRARARGRAAVVAGAALLVASSGSRPAVGQQPPSPPTPAEAEALAVPHAGARVHVVLSLDGWGGGTVAIRAPPGVAEDAASGQALVTALGCRPVVGGADEDPELEATGFVWPSGRCDALFQRRGAVVEGELPLAAVAERLRPEGVARLTIVVVHPPVPYSSCRDAAAPLGAYAPCQREVPLDDTMPASLEIAYGYRSADLFWILGPLAAAFAAPVAVILWTRRSALRAAGADPAAVWFGFWRVLRLVLSAAWVGWVALAFALPVRDLLEFVLGLSQVAELEAAMIAVYFLPPAAVGVACAGLAHPVMARVRGSGFTRGEVVRQAFWSEAAALLPLMFVLTGLHALNRGDSRWAALSAFGALASHGFASRRSVAAHDLVPHALTTGELRDRVFALADEAGVRLRQLYLVPGARARLGNAFAVLGGQVMLTDTLGTLLTKRELDAIVAHELAHLKHGHPRTLLLVTVAALVAAAVIQPHLVGALGLHRAGWLVLAGLVALALLGRYFVSRRFETAADAAAVDLTGDGEALITALVKLARMNLLPLQWGSWSERTLTHPSTLRRARAAARRAGIPEERLAEILARGETGAEHYPMPGAAAAAEGRIFTTAFKGRVALRHTIALTAVLTVTPALLAWAVAGWHLAGQTAALAYAAGLLGTALLFVVVRNFLARSGDRGVRRQLQERLERQGLVPPESRAVFVGLAPGAGLRLYEGFTEWDVGFLFVSSEGDRLVFVGELARFALSRDQVGALGVARSSTAWWFGARVEVDWSDRERQTHGTFTLVPTGSTLWSKARRARELAGRLRAWRAGGRPGDAGARAPEVLGLGPPQIGDVTSMPVRDLASGNVMVGAALVSAAVAWGVSLVLDVAAAYPVGTAALLSLLQWLPFRLHRDRPPVDAGGRAQDAPPVDTASGPAETRKP